MRLLKFGLAMIFAACASFCTASGLILMKIGIIKSEVQQTKYSYLLKVWWLSGLAFLLAGQILNGSKFFKYF